MGKHSFRLFYTQTHGVRSTKRRLLCAQSIWSCGLPCTVDSWEDRGRTKRFRPRETCWNYQTKPSFQHLIASIRFLPSLLEEIWDGTPRGYLSVIKNMFFFLFFFFVQMSSYKFWARLKRLFFFFVNECYMYLFQVNQFKIFHNRFTFIKMYIFLVFYFTVILKNKYVF